MAPPSPRTPRAPRSRQEARIPHQPCRPGGAELRPGGSRRRPPAPDQRRERALAVPRAAVALRSRRTRGAAARCARPAASRTAWTRPARMGAISPVSDHDARSPPSARARVHGAGGRRRRRPTAGNVRADLAGIAPWPRSIMSALDVEALAGFEPAKPCFAGRSVSHSGTAPSCCNRWSFRHSAPACRVSRVLPAGVEPAAPASEAGVLSAGPRKRACAGMDSNHRVRGNRFTVGRNRPLCYRRELGRTAGLSVLSGGLEPPASWV